MKLHFTSRRFRGEQFQADEQDENELIMLVDLDRCIGCGACALACEIEHEGSLGVGAPMRPVLAAIDTEQSRMVPLPTTCRHCETPCEYQSDYNFWVMCPSKETKQSMPKFCDSCVARQDEGQYPPCAQRCTMKTIFFGRPREMELVLADRRLREKGDVEFEG